MLINLDHCRAYCGSNHFKNYEECYVPQTSCLNNCNGNGDCNTSNCITKNKLVLFRIN